jgi:hypothetical protein
MLLPCVTAQFTSLAMFQIILSILEQYVENSISACYLLHYIDYLITNDA